MRARLVAAAAAFVPLVVMTGCTFYESASTPPPANSAPAPVVVPVPIPSAPPAHSEGSGMMVLLVVGLIVAAAAIAFLFAGVRHWRAQATTAERQADRAQREAQHWQQLILADHRLALTQAPPATPQEHPVYPVASQRMQDGYPTTEQVHQRIALERYGR